MPSTLRPFPAVTQADIAAARHRTFEFDQEDDAWAINERFFDPARPIATPAENTPEIWTLINDGGDWWHPIHIHLDLMRVLRRNGRVPPVNERDGVAKKDTWIADPPPGDPREPPPLEAGAVRAEPRCPSRPAAP